MKKFTLLLTLLVATSAFAGKKECVIPKLDLDKVPFPIKSANTKFDLAEGETYVLNGIVVKKDGLVFFQIDFDSQPWLATQYRLDNPFFVVDPTDVELMSKVGSGELVQMAVVIKRPVQISSGIESRKIDRLRLLARPIPFR